MQSDARTLQNPVTLGAGLASKRSPQSRRDIGLPENLEIVSADTHVEINKDIFFENFPERLKEKAPRVWFDGYWHVGYPQGMQAAGVGVPAISFQQHITYSPGFDFAIRNRDMDIEGVSKEIAYPQSLLGFIRYPDIEVQEQMYRVYNEWIARLGAENPGRFYGVGICSNWWDPDKAEAAVQQIAGLGIKSLLLPNNPGKDLNGEPIDYANPQMDRFWSAVEDADLPVSFHIGENPSFDGPGGFGSNFLVQVSPFRKTFGKLIFGGVLDRHPKLKIVFAEAGINWVASALQDAELTFDVHYDMFDIKPKNRPSSYWRNHCYATFQFDTIGLDLIDYIGADRVMWASDYPHSEGAFGINWNAMEAVIVATGPEVARSILGDTARSLYRLD